MDPTKRVSITYVNDTGLDDFSVYLSGMPYMPSDPSSFVAWQTLRAQSTAAFLFPASVGVGLVWEGVTYGPKLTPQAATWEVTTTKDMEPVFQQGKLLPLTEDAVPALPCKLACMHYIHYSVLQHLSCCAYSIVHVECEHVFS